MSLYQRKDLKTGADIGQPGPLPRELVGLKEESLADLSWADDFLGYKRQAFVLVAEASLPAPTGPTPMDKLLVVLEAAKLLTAEQVKEILG